MAFLEVLFVLKVEKVTKAGLLVWNRGADNLLCFLLCVLTAILGGSDGRFIG